MSAVPVPAPVPVPCHAIPVPGPVPVPVPGRTVPVPGHVMPGRYRAAASGLVALQGRSAAEYGTSRSRSQRAENREPGVHGESGGARIRESRVEN